MNGPSKRFKAAAFGAAFLLVLAWARPVRAQSSGCHPGDVELSRSVTSTEESETTAVSCKPVSRLRLKDLGRISAAAEAKLSPEDRASLASKRGELTGERNGPAAVAAAKLPFMPDEELAAFERQLRSESHSPAASALLLALEAALLATGGLMLAGFSGPFERLFPGARKGLALGALLGFGVCASVQFAAGIPLTTARAAVTSVAPAVGYAPGEAQSALEELGRVQKAAQHLTDAGVLPNWNNGEIKEAVLRGFTEILEHPRLTFDHPLKGGEAVRAFIGEFNGKEIAVFVYKEGARVGQLATAWLPSADQAKRWGL